MQSREKAWLREANASSSSDQPISDARTLTRMERQEGQDIPLPPDGDKFPGAATDLLLRPVQKPLLSSTAHTNENSTEPFSLRAPPSTGYVPGCYLPGPPLPPLGHFTTSANRAGSACTHRSWTSYPGASTFGTGHPPPPFSTPCTSFPNLFGANDNTLPPAMPLSHHHPEPDSSLSSPAVHCRKRKRADEELVAPIRTFTPTSRARCSPSYRRPRTAPATVATHLWTATGPCTRCRIPSRRRPSRRTASTSRSLQRAKTCGRSSLRPTQK